MKKIDIVLLSYLRHEFTLQCIEHIVKRTVVPFRLILVINGAWEHEKAVLDQYRSLNERKIVDHLLLLGENYGVHAGKNVALPLVHSQPYYVDMDNDILVPDVKPDWISQLTKLMDDNMSFGSISLRPQVLVGRSGKEFDVAGEVVKFSHTGAHGRIMRTDVVKTVGGWRKVWDAKRNNEDRWIAGQLGKRGFSSGYAKNVRCWHLFGDDEKDPWGYPKGQKPEDHGHVERWPPVNKYSKMKDYDTDTWQKK